MVSAPGGTTALDRRRAVATLLRDRGDLLVVTGLGSPTYDVHAAGDHDTNFYLWGAMGGAALVGLGLAQAQPHRTVLVVTGDGEQTMGLGGLATIGVSAPKNLVVAVLDNGYFGETGMQRSHAGLGVDLAGVARACGLEAETVRDEPELERLRGRLHEPRERPLLAVLKVASETLPRSLAPRDAVHLKNRFRAALGLPVS